MKREKTAVDEMSKNGRIGETKAREDRESRRGETRK